MPVSFTLGEETLILILLGLIVPAIIVGIKTYFGTRQNHRCIVRLEKLIDAAIEERKEEVEKLKGFFIDWIQRLENVTRDRRIDERVESQPSRPKSQQQEDTQQNNIEKKIDELINSINKLVESKPT